MAGIRDTNINNKKYLSISDDVVVVGDDDCDVDAVLVLSTLWILNPKTKKQATKKKEITLRRFCIILGMITIGRLCAVLPPPLLVKLLTAPKTAPNCGIT